jgi:hypothetical protein
MFVLILTGCTKSVRITETEDEVLQPAVKIIIHNNTNINMREVRLRRSPENRDRGFTNREWTSGQMSDLRLVLNLYSSSSRTIFLPERFADDKYDIMLKSNTNGITFFNNNVIAFSMFDVLLTDGREVFFTSDDKAPIIHVINNTGGLLGSDNFSLAGSVFFVLKTINNHITFPDNTIKSFIVEYPVNFMNGYDLYFTARRGFNLVHHAKFNYHIADGDTITFSASDRWYP